jgi:hypothetical protein
MPASTHHDAGAAMALDAATAIADSGSRMDASARDAAMSAPPVRDTSNDAAAAGALDARAPVPDSAGIPNDGAVHESTDSGRVDAGAIGLVDAAANDAAVDGGPINLCPERSDALFCDGFEGTFAPWAYTVIVNGTAAPTTARYHSGGKSLHATTGPAKANTAARYGARVFAHQKSGEIWLRYYYYLPSSSVVKPAFSTGVVAEGEPPYFGFALLVLPARVDIGVGSTMYHGTQTLPRDKWTCIELHVQIDASIGIFEAYLDGTLAVRSPGTNTLPAMGYTTVDIGVHYTDPAQGPVEIYADDVVAGNTRVGCN